MEIVDAPNYKDGIVCPDCERTDTKTIYSSKFNWILWCCCGKVFACKDGIVQKVFEF